MKIKESKKCDQYLDLARERRKEWNMKVKVIPITISALGTVPRGFEGQVEKFEIGERIKTIETTALPRSARILRRVLET